MCHCQAPGLAALPSGSRALLSLLQLFTLVTLLKMGQRILHKGAYQESLCQGLSGVCFSVAAAA